MNAETHIWRKEPAPDQDRKYDPTDSRWAYIEPDGTPNREMLERVKNSIVKQITPLRIILFGSAARGEMHAHSDIDLLVIKEGLGPRRGHTAGQIRGQLPAERRGVDIMLISPEEAEQNRDEVYQAVGQALAHGRTIYERLAKDVAADGTLGHPAVSRVIVTIANRDRILTAGQNDPPPLGETCHEAVNDFVSTHHRELVQHIEQRIRESRNRLRGLTYAAERLRAFDD